MIDDVQCSGCGNLLTDLNSSGAGRNWCLWRCNFSTKLDVVLVNCKSGVTAKLKHSSEMVSS